MPRKKEYTIRMKEAGIKFIVLMVVVAQRPESQLTRSLRANLTRHDLTFVTVPESQLADIDDLSKKVLKKVQDVISRSTT
ncbi:hypothetical protein LSAT2_011756 [Lamellibrachia satsuma]|nr:hypothetical protein LSAT2_011756 [Lamellibrachia satsuma]